MIVVQIVLGGLFVILMAQAVFGSSRTNLIIALLLSFFGVICLFIANASWQDWVIALTNNSGLVALFIAVPFFSFLLTYEDYRGAINRFFQSYIHRRSSFSILTAWLSYLLSIMLNLAGIHILYSLLIDYAKEYRAENNFYRALVRGNLAGVFWAPNFMSVAIVLTYLDISWVEIAPKGFLLSCLLMVVISLFFVEGASLRFIKDEDTGIICTQNTSQEPSWKLLFKLFMVYCGLVIFVTFLNLYTSMKILTIISLTALVYPLLIAVIKNKLAVYNQELKKYYLGTLPDMKNEILLFASVGFFGKALDITGVGSWLLEYLHLESIAIPSVTILILIFTVGLLSVLGIHPLVTIAALAAAVSHDAIGLSLHGYAYTLLLSYAVGILASPFSIISLIMAGLTGKDTYSVVVRLNMGYLLSITILFALLIPLL